MATKRIRLSDTEFVEVKTDWSKCCLCQTVTNEKLSSPQAKRVEHIDGYTNLAANIPEFERLNKLPLPLNSKRLNEGDGIEETLRRNCAKYHNSCKLKFKDTKLEKSKRVKGQNGTDDITIKYNKREPLEDKHNIVASYTCFFCEKELGNNDTREAMTMQLNEHLNRTAEILQDKKLIAKLSSGDVVAQEVKYHTKCLVSIYNRERAIRNLNIKSTDEEKSVHDEAFELAFAEMESFIYESQRNSDGTIIIFKLSSLYEMFTARLRQLGFPHEVHRSRFKDRILEKIPSLEANKSGREIVFAFKNDIGPTIVKACDYDTAKELANSAKQVRGQMLSTSYNFTGEFESSCQEKSVPQSLVELVSMIDYGSNIATQLEETASKSTLALSQLLQFNCRPNASSTYHSKKFETPFPIFVGLLIYTRTRKRQLIDELHSYGISISYDRVLEISSQFGGAIVEKYIEENVICPGKLRKHVFTTAAADNIDHNPGSTSAKSSFHGTGISIFQHPDDDNSGTPRDLVALTGKSVSKKIPELPASYTNLKPASIRMKPVPTDCDISLTQFPSGAFSKLLDFEYQWLNHVNLDITNAEDLNMSWPAYHASQQRAPKISVCINAMLPLLPDSSHTVTTIKHCMDKIKEVTYFLNPTQTPVMAVDQPLFAIAKQIQWTWPELYGEHHFVVMFGGLHIEMAVLKVLGELLKGSGWTDLLAEAGVASEGTANSFLTASSVTKTRQAHQITVCSMYLLLCEAYEQFKTESRNCDELDMQSWRKDMEKSHSLFRFWSMIIDLELLMLVFVRAIREGDFSLYKEALNEIMPYMFSLDHINYARWLTVHLRDMLDLDNKAPDVAESFKNGHFTVKKTSRDFSCIAIDHAHEQNNAMVKGDGGIIGITEDPAALRRWTIAGPELNRVVEEFKGLSSCEENNRNARKHHMQSQAYEKEFVKNCLSLMEEIRSRDNPFREESDDLFTLDSKIVADHSVVSALKNLREIGLKQYHIFWNSIKEKKDSAFNEPIKKNKLPLIGRKTKEISRGTNEQKSNECLFSRLFISCQTRGCDLEEFFSHENAATPPSLSTNGNLNPGTTKSDLMKVLEIDRSQAYTEPEADCIIIDGAAMINANPPGDSKTFQEYVNNVVIRKIETYTFKYDRIDIIFDRYFESSLKSFTREKRGQGIRRKVTGNSKIPTGWWSFLRVDENKTDLFQYVADEIAAHSYTGNGCVLVTRFEDVLTTKSSIPLNGISPCNHEEADTRIFLHANQAAIHGARKIIIQSTDTDVVVLAISCFSKLNLEELWISFGHGKHFRWVPIHDIVHKLDKKALGLPFFHAFTGCDTVSSFTGKGKLSAWNTWCVYEDATNTFCRLSNRPETITIEDMDVLEQFVVLLYDRSSACVNVNQARLDLFAKKQRPYDRIPPTQDALHQHSKRAAYQAGHIWAQSMTSIQVLPDVVEWGWECLENKQIKPFWFSMPVVAASCQELQKCGCQKKACDSRLCSCFRVNLTCTLLCSCNC